MRATLLVVFLINLLALPFILLNAPTDRLDTKLFTRPIKGMIAQRDLDATEIDLFRPHILNFLDVLEASVLKRERTQDLVDAALFLLAGCDCLVIGLAYLHLLQSSRQVPNVPTT